MQYHHKDFIHVRHTNEGHPISYRLISSGWAGYHNLTRRQINEFFIPSFLTVNTSPACDVLLVPNTLVLPPFVISGHNHYCNVRGQFTSSRTYSLHSQPQLQPHENREQLSCEIKDASNNNERERAESFITGGNPHLADLWREINSFDYEAFVESIEGNYHDNVSADNNAMNNVQQIQTSHLSPQKHISICKYENVTDEFVDVKLEIENNTCCSITTEEFILPKIEQETLSQKESQNPLILDTKSPDISDSSQSLQDCVSSNNSNRKITVPSPSTSPRSSPTSSPHLNSIKFDEYLYDAPKTYEEPFNSKYRYKCTVPSCTQRFKEYRSLMSHLRINHGHHGKNILDHRKRNGKAMVQCAKCQRFFVSKWYLKKHRKFCHENGKQGEWIDCEYCQKSYLTDCERKKHYAKDHSDKIKELWEQQWC
ncbi:unnamed protein product [Rhizophagus irregularis]|uniref:C2H2-type domain-containing protein n=1 Tax=Rhizophagus irregularis TaxID=588596 RepID=A0A2I1FTZ7_9GLOM|nr:hypothetical protein RhiirA4_496440 [Rhizophagus irregularis]CAB4416683.1 unnamed protein product [Rhizophagus irregularis]